jgi:anaerobic carbon-monoxide dehydrogenase iron sulfur subunit
MSTSRPQDRKFVSADPDKCIGCVVCEYACSMVNEKTYNPTKSRIRAMRIGPLENMAVTCRHCEDPPCVAACPREALSQDENTGIIHVDESACNGCNWCVSACNFGAMMLHPEKKIAFTCNACEDQPDGPQCVKWCPEEALTFVTAEVLAQKSRQTAVKNLFQQAAEKSKSK